MLNKNKMAEFSQYSENLVYTNMTDIYQAIELHASLGFYEAEFYVDKKLMNRAFAKLDKKGFYCRTFEFKSLPKEGKLYVSWGF